MPFQLIGHLRLLTEFEVTFIIVGGVASRIQGAAITTQDLDITPELSDENLERLAAALSSPVTMKKDANSTTYVPHPHVDASEFRTDSPLSYQTSMGILDVISELPGGGTYDVLKNNARNYAMENVTLTVASLDDVIRSKELADRAKDWRAMDALYAARDELKERPDDFEIRVDQLDEDPGTDDSQ